MSVITKSTYIGVLSQQKWFKNWKSSKPQIAYALTSFLDIEGSFDNTTFKSIATAKSSIGISSTITGIGSNMLRCRWIRVTVGLENYLHMPRLLMGVLKVVYYLLLKTQWSSLWALNNADDVAIIIIVYYPEMVFNLMLDAFWTL